MTSRSLRPVRVPGMLLALAGLVLALTAAGPASPAAADSTPETTCNNAVYGAFHCMSRWSSPWRSDHPLTPADIAAVYQLPSSGGEGQTIGIVSAYDNPNVESDLATYREKFNLPACTTANGCFTKADQRGTTTYPQGHAGWGVESALGVQAVSAVCPACKIVLVEADTPGIDDMGEAVNTAVRLGATVVSNGYGTDEFAGMNRLAKKYYTHPGVPIVAASGYSFSGGFDTASFPAVLRNVWAIGGTELWLKDDGTWLEKADFDSGSGCSAYITKPPRQSDPDCGMRTTSDIAAVSSYFDGGFSVYDTYGLGDDNGWIETSGTSLSSALIAGMIGLAGNATKVANPAYAYRHRSGLYDVVEGFNGDCGDDDGYLCYSVEGYDGPTGLGTPRGLKAL